MRVLTRDCKQGRSVRTDLPDVNWLETQPERCYFYPGRDCPGWGAGGTCSRIDERIPEGEPCES